MARKPSKKQRHWVEEFCKQRPKSRIINIKDATCGYFYYTIAWDEDLPVYAPSNEEDEELDLGMGWITHQLYVELTPAGIDRLRQQTIMDIVYPHCQLNWRRSMVTAQTVLPIPQVLELPPEPVKRTTSKRRKKSNLNLTQHQLPIDPLGEEILDIRLRRGGEVQSRQDLLSQKVPHYSLEMGTVIHLNQALIDLLKEVNATSKEWESAEMLLGVIGEAGVLHYIKQIPAWRKYHRIEVALTVPVVTKPQQPQIQTQSI
ncbi:MAG: hypothetical protein V7K47_06960 [Nostoc sp.]